MIYHSPENVAIQIFSESGEELTSGPVVLPCSTTSDHLQILCNKLLENVEPVPISFKIVGGNDVSNSIAEAVDISQLVGEKPLRIVYLPQAIFKVSPVTRCTTSLPGHTEAIVSVAFSPDGKKLASGSGDKTVRIWDLQIELPEKTLSGHNHWVLCISWSPSGLKLASACKLGKIFLWDTLTWQQIGRPLSGHKEWINSLSWQPLHMDSTSRLLASAGRDSTVRIWDTVQYSAIRVLSGHTASVTCVRWGGCGLIYSCSQDRTIKVWRADDGVICKNLTGHSHWINTLALNVDYVLRTGSYSPMDSANPIDSEGAKMLAKRKYESILGGRSEKLVSGSDDFTMFFWEPSEKKQPLIRMTGHQQLVNQVLFSPDTRIIASASFDKSVKLWDGYSGKFICTLHGHVQAVYQITWSADSRLLLSGSADSTLKVWDIKGKKLMLDLPGHGADVYAVDWSPDGKRVASGGKDCVLKLWRR